MRTSSAYLAAYRRWVTHSDCVTIVREALRETGPALPAGAAHFVDTRVDTGFRAIASDPTQPDILPEWRPGRMLTNVDIEAARHCLLGAALLANVSAWPGLANPPAG